MYDAGARLAGADFQVASTTAGACAQTTNWDLSGLQYDASGNITSAHAQEQHRHEPRRALRTATQRAPTSSPAWATRATRMPGPRRTPTRTTPTARWRATFSRSPRSVGYHEVTLGMTLDRRKLPVSLLAERMTFAGDASGDYSLTASYRYAASGERYWKNVSGSVEYYLLTGSATGRSQQVGVFTGTSGNALRHWNILTPSGEAIGRIPSTGLRQYYAKDHLGSTRAVVNESNAIVERHDFDAYGMELQGRGLVGSPVLNERYTGHQWDGETGLLYAGARFLDPAIGRWLSVDPLADKYPAWSPYNYALNSPLLLRDPDGRAPCCLFPMLFNPRIAQAVWRTVSTTASSLLNPANVVSGVKQVGRGYDGFENGSTPSERLAGVRDVVDGVGTVAGMVENYASATAGVATAAGQPEIAAPALAVGTVAGRFSSGADVAGLAIETTLVLSGSEQGSEGEVVKRGVSVVVNRLPIHVRHDQLDAFLKSLGINIVDEVVDSTEGREDDGQ